MLWLRRARGSDLYLFLIKDKPNGLLRGDKLAEAVAIAGGLLYVQADAESVFFYRHKPRALARNSALIALNSSALSSSRTE
jgi:hypothetical protein